MEVGVPADPGTSLLSRVSRLIAREPDCFTTAFTLPEGSAAGLPKRGEI